MILPCRDSEVNSLLIDNREGYWESIFRAIGADWNVDDGDYVDEHSDAERESEVLVLFASLL